MTNWTEIRAQAYEPLPTEPTMGNRDAITILRSAGYDVEAADIPGLYFVNGTELTMGQVLSLASEVYNG